MCQMHEICAKNHIIYTTLHTQYKICHSLPLKNSRSAHSSWVIHPPPQNPESRKSRALLCFSIRTIRIRISSRNVGLQKWTRKQTHIIYPAVMIKTLIYHIVKKNNINKKQKHHTSQTPPRAPLPVLSATPETPCFDGRLLQGTFASVPHHHLGGEGLDFPSRDAGHTLLPLLGLVWLP